jgi:hypothetical protein
LCVKDKEGAPLVNRVLDLVGIEVEHELFQRWERERGEKMSQSVLVPRAGNLF